MVRQLQSEDVLDHLEAPVKAKAVSLGLRRERQASLRLLQAIRKQTAVYCCVHSRPEPGRNKSIEIQLIRPNQMNYTLSNVNMPQL